MQLESLTLAEILNLAQGLAGLIVLASLLIVFHRSGQLRRAFDFPPAAPNGLTGAHVLLLVAATYAVTLLLSMFFQSMGMAPPPATPAGITATQTAPAATEPTLETLASQPATQPSAAVTQPSTPSPQEEILNLLVQAAAEAIMLLVILNFVRNAFADGLAGWGLRTDRLGRDLFWVLAGYLAFWPICLAIASLATLALDWAVPWWKPPEHKVLVFLEEPGLSPLWGVLAWVLAGVVAPFFEEVFFRGLLLTWLRGASRSTWLAIVVSGLCFGLIHAPQWHLVPALASLGLLLGYLYARTGSLTLVILLHMVFNLRTLVLFAIGDRSTP